MTKFFIAMAFAVALPSIAHAQTVPAAPAKEDCCAEMKAKGKKCCCCDDMDKKSAAEHDMDGMKHDKQ